MNSMFRRSSNSWFCAPKECSDYFNIFILRPLWAHSARAKSICGENAMKRIKRLSLHAVGYNWHSYLYNEEQ